VAGIPQTNLEWLAGLVRSRVTTIMPMTNAIGYHKDTR
jgi:hypothetical protein